MKPTKRKAFNFLRSYFDVLTQLQNDSDKLAFLMAIIDKQFLDKDPEGLDFIPNLCYESQRHSIESSINGWKRVNKTDVLGNPANNPVTNPTTNPKQEEDKVEEKEKVEVESEKTKITEVDFLKSGQAKDNAHMAIRAHLQNLDDDGYFKILNDFYIEQIGKAKIWTNQRETQSHFVSWAKKQPFDKKPEPPKKLTAQDLWVP